MAQRDGFTDPFLESRDGWTMTELPYSTKTVEVSVFEIPFDFETRHPFPFQLNKAPALNIENWQRKIESQFYSPGPSGGPDGPDGFEVWNS